MKKEENIKLQLKRLKSFSWFCLSVLCLYGVKWWIKYVNYIAEVYVPNHF